jgi:hypothetical protein
VFLLFFINSTASLGIQGEFLNMGKIILVLTSLIFVGCASLPSNYSQLTSEQFLKGVANNNKPKIIPAKYINEYSEKLSMIAANYNVVGSYTSSMVLDGIEEASKLCRDKGLSILGTQDINERKVLACGINTVSFLAIHYVSRENAGYDTGHTYAYFDHIALFDITSNLANSDLEWISKKYISFENKTIDLEHVHDFHKLKETELIKLLSVYL